MAECDRIPEFCLLDCQQEIVRTSDPHARYVCGCSVWRANREVVMARPRFAEGQWMAVQVPERKAAPQAVQESML